MNGSGRCSAESCEEPESNLLDAAAPWSHDPWALFRLFNWLRSQQSAIRNVLCNTGVFRAHSGWILIRIAPVCTLLLYSWFGHSRIQKRVTDSPPCINRTYISRHTLVCGLCCPSSPHHAVHWILQCIHAINLYMLETILLLHRRSWAKISCTAELAKSRTKVCKYRGIFIPPCHKRHSKARWLDIALLALDNDKSVN